VVSAIYLPANLTVFSRASGASETVTSGLPINDSLVNHTNKVQPVFYTFSPRIYDNRPGHEGEFCGNGNDTIIKLWVNPTPRIEVGIDDTILCDNALITIEVLNGLDPDIQGTSVYDLDVTYTPGAVAGSITGDGEKSDFIDISDLLINNTVKFAGK